MEYSIFKSRAKPFITLSVKQPVCVTHFSWLSSEIFFVDVGVGVRLPVPLVGLFLISSYINKIT
jgi:hypothetical protein